MNIHKNHIVSICIPIYKEQPNHNEIVSFKQCLKILGQYKIFIITHKSLNLSFYLDEFNTHHIDYGLKFFDEKYFANIKGYNKLMLSSGFYKAFKEYEYILIYQLDAYVFRNELKEWCKKNYSYVGAPWIYNKNNSLEFDGVGNGGLSLRNVRHHIRVLHTFTYQTSPITLLKRYFTCGKSIKSYIQLTAKFIKQLTISNNTYHLFNDYKLNEDNFWGRIAANKISWFIVPPPEEALKFSMELESSHLYKLNNNELPFGCHAWDKYEPNFWRNVIDFSSCEQ